MIADIAIFSDRGLGKNVCEGPNPGASSYSGSRIYKSIGMKKRGRMDAGLHDDSSSNLTSDFVRVDDRPLRCLDEAPARRIMTHGALENGVTMGSFALNQDFLDDIFGSTARFAADLVCVGERCVVC